MKQTAPRSKVLPPAATMLAQYAAKKPRASKAERQAGMALRLLAAAKKSSPEVTTATAPEAALPPGPPVSPGAAAPAAEAPRGQPPPEPPRAERPIPAAHQVWSCASPKNGGRRYVRLVVIHRPSALGKPSADAVEILADGTRRLDTILKREYMRISFEPNGSMPPTYFYEPTVTGTETLDLSTNRDAARNGDAEEITMSQNTQTATATTATLPPLKKAALAAMAKATEKKLTAREKAAAAKPAKAAVTAKAKKNGSREFTVPAPGTVIHKVYKGKELEPIKALAAGRFSYKGKTYETIHELGSFIRGGKPTWAYEFFGLVKK